ncbi:MAG: VTT domain-containing protein [Acidobacteriaceae bacterium]|nr:VTT domain-containing protein [Acidobacteriaceae bacterium]
MLLSWGPHGLFLLAILDSTGLPVVGGVDALLITVATERPADAYMAAFWAVLGSLAGSLILFAIARKGGEVLLSKHISSRTGARLHLWFQRYGLVTVFIPALSPLPLPMKIPVFCAGALEVRWSYFIAVVLSARAIRYFALAYLGRHYGHQTFEYLVAHGIQVAVIALTLAIASVVALRLVQRHRAAEGELE